MLDKDDDFCYSVYMKVYIRYQVCDANGNPALEPYKDYGAAKYMVDAYFIGGCVVEVEMVVGENND